MGAYAMKKQLLIWLIVISLVLSIANAQDSIPIPHGIDGYVYSTETGSQVAAGTHFSINDTTSGFFYAGITGLGPFTGRYSVAVMGSDGDTVIVRAWTNFSSASTTVTLQGALHDINLYLNTTAPLAPLNNPPTFTSSPSLSALVGSQYSYDANAPDPEGSVVVYSLSASPQGMTIDSSSGLLQWTPSVSQIGANQVIVIASDGSQSSTQSFTIQVSAPANNMPIIISTAPTQATGLQQYSYQITATDADSDALTYQLLQSPSGMSVSSNGLILWTPTDSQAGQTTIILAVLDNKGGSATQTFTIAVLASGNHAPQIISTPSSSATQGATYAYYVDAYDADGNAIVFSIVDAPLGMSINSTSGLLKWTPSASGSFAINIRATDIYGVYSTQSYTLTVNSAPQVTLQYTIEGTILSSQSNTASAQGTRVILNNTDTGSVIEQLSGNLTASNSFSFVINAISGQHITLTALNSTHRVQQDFTLSQLNTRITLYLAAIAPLQSSISSASSSSSGSAGVSGSSLSESGSAGAIGETQASSFTFTSSSSDVAITQVFSSNVIGSTLVKAQKANAPEFMQAPSQKVYQYLLISSNTSSNDFVITFKISKVWAAENNVDTLSVALYQNSTEWIKLPTRKIAEDSSYYYFESDSLTAGLFAIGASSAAAVQGAPILSQFPIAGKILLSPGVGASGLELAFTNTRTNEIITVTTGNGATSGTFSLIMDGQKGDSILLSIDGSQTYTLTLGNDEGPVYLVYSNVHRSLVPLTGALVGPTSSNPLTLVSAGLVLALIVAGTAGVVTLKKIKSLHFKKKSARIISEHIGPAPLPHDDLEIKHAQMQDSSNLAPKIVPNSPEQSLHKHSSELQNIALRPEQFFYLSDGSVITSLTELRYKIDKIPQDIFEHHVTEAKNDFANWTEHVFKSPELAGKLRQCKNPSEMKQIIEQFIGGE